MFKTMRNMIVRLLSVAMLVVVPIATPALASAASTPPTSIQKGICSGVNNAAGTTDKTTSNCSNSSGGTHVTGLVQDIINIFSWIVGVASVIMIIVGGFRYITSGGESSNVSSAKNTIIYAIIGLVIVALAQFIVQFVLNKVVGS